MKKITKLSLIKGLYFSSIFAILGFISLSEPVYALSLSDIKESITSVLNKTTSNSTTTLETNFSSKVETNNKKYKAGDEVKINYSITNKSLKTLKFDFTSGCQLKTSGPFVENDQICTQALTSVSILPGRTYSWKDTQEIKSNTASGEYSVSAELIGYSDTKESSKIQIVSSSTVSVATSTKPVATSTKQDNLENIKVPVRFDLSKPKIKNNSSVSEVSLSVKRASVRAVVADFVRKNNPLTKWTLDVTCPSNVSVTINASSTENNICGKTEIISEGKDASKLNTIKEKLNIKNLASSTQDISFTVKAYDQYGVVGSTTKEITVKTNATTTVVNSSTKTFLNIPYLNRANSTDNLTSLDIYLPKSSDKLNNAPVAVLVHGGGFSKGDKASLDFIVNKQEFFNNLGYIVVSVNYRLSPDVVHPTHIQDVDAAINWVEDNIKNYGGDGSKMVLLGHSAGATLVLLAVTDEDKLEEAGVNRDSIDAVISLDTGSTNVPLKISSLSSSGTSTPIKEIIEDMKIENFTSAFTNNIETQKDASVYYQITEGEELPPMFLAYVASRKDTIEQREQFTQKLDELTETDYVLGLYKGYDHASINENFGKSGDKVTKDAKKFLKEFVK